MGVVTKYTSTLSGPSSSSRSRLASEISNYTDDQGKGRLDRSNSYFYLPSPETEKTETPAAPIGRSDRFKRGEIFLEGFIGARAQIAGIERTSPIDTETKR